ncbi:hypothetical protein B0H34DRAFT_671506 [Crassisporium funariophilum]|nr:hypothetical protein B0H34DRAFT_671506 [Crassisporium funariophilum]
MSISPELMLIMSTQYQLGAMHMQSQSYDLVEGMDGSDLEEINDEDLEYELSTAGGTIMEMSKLSGDALWKHLQETAPIQRGPYDQIQKCEQYFENALQWPDLSRATFDKLVTKLEANPIFTSRGRKPQRAANKEKAKALEELRKEKQKVTGPCKCVPVRHPNGEVIKQPWANSRGSTAAAVPDPDSTVPAKRKQTATSGSKTTKSKK